MYIQSKFKDYYDHVQQWNQDPDKKWNRQYTYVEDSFPRKKLTFIAPVRIIVIGFCGKVYHGIKCYKFNLASYKPTYNYVKTVWNLDDYIKFREEYFNFDKSQTQQLKTFFDPVEDDTVFVKYHTPIFLTGDFGFYVDDKDVIFLHGISYYEDPKYLTKKKIKPVTLEKYDFQNQFSDVQAYSSLESYLHFLKCEHKEVPEPSNDDKIDLSGLSKKSFRK